MWNIFEEQIAVIYVVIFNGSDRETKFLEETSLDMLIGEAV